MSTGHNSFRARYLPDYLGSDPTILDVVQQVEQIAGFACSVTLLGESGTGKELIARAIHDASPRASGPMLAINCAALSESVVESELFGHVRGAFTGADRARPGLFAAANGGTLFLDEIAELALPIQSKLLRVLQEGEVRPVGATRATKIDVRIITASHVLLASAVEDGRFREDLFYRLNVFPIELPALRDRPGDLEELVTHFVKRSNEQFGCQVVGATHDLIDGLAGHDWPGNVRELENLISRLVVMRRAGMLSAADLPQEFGSRRKTNLDRPSQPHRSLPAREPVTAPVPTSAAEVAPLADPAPETPSRRPDLHEQVAVFERTLIEDALRDAGGNKSEAARRLGVRRTTLVAKIKKHFGDEIASGEEPENVGLAPQPAAPDRRMRRGERGRQCGETARPPQMMGAL